MKKFSQTQTELTINRDSAKVPQSLMNSSRTEFGSDGVSEIWLECIEGKIPTDLYGHMFIVGPVGFEDTPYGHGIPVFNGDGMVYRLDFDRPGKVRLKTEIARTPCFYADLATRTRKKYQAYRFRNWGNMRFSAALGLRNPVNTAFLPIKSPQEPHHRLLMTYDAGRPYEIDPVSLKIKTAVGTNQEWRSTVPQIKPLFNQVFPVVLSTAHPACDEHTGEVFTINYGRSISNLLSTIPLIDGLNDMPQTVQKMLEPLVDTVIGNKPVQQFLGMGFKFTQDVFKGSTELINKLLSSTTGIEIEDFTYLIRWNRQGSLERWKLVLEDSSPVKIEQSVHQIGVTKDFIVIIDTAFKVGVDQILNNPLPDAEKTETALRTLLTRPQFPDSKVYLVPRDRLNTEQGIEKTKEREITVIPLILPLESIHFAVDYEASDLQDSVRKINLYITHNCATDVSEAIRSYDRSAFSPEHNLPSRLNGMLAIGQMDVNRIGRYVIDGDRGLVLDSKVVHNQDYTFGVGLITYRERLLSGAMAKQIEDIYGHSWGFWEELMPEFIFDLYKNYKYRLMSIEEIRQLPQKPKPVYLFRLHTSTMEFADVYQFDSGYMMSSPQFVPRKDSTDSSTDGYIVCTVNTPDKDEIWIFDAAKLSAGPVCKLGYSGFNFGYTIHTAWLPEISNSTSDYHVSVRKDYQELIKQRCRRVQDLFEKHIYPKFEN